MRYAIVSDLHANLWAWRAIWSDLRLHEVDELVCLGDVVGYGSRPAEVLELCREKCVATVVGNHDAAVAGIFDTSVFNHRAREVIDWTATRLSGEQIEWLAGLPLWWRPEDASFLAVHAEVEDPGRFGYIASEEEARGHFAACEDTLVFFGHTHHAGVLVLEPGGRITYCEAENFQLQPGQRYLINPGSVGDPRTAEATARYAIFDSAEGAVTFHAVSFDAAACRDDVTASGLPHRQAFLRLLDGEADEPESVAAGFHPDETRRITVRADNPYGRLVRPSRARAGEPQPSRVGNSPAQPLVPRVGYGSPRSAATSTRPVEAKVPAVAAPRPSVTRGEMFGWIIGSVGLLCLLFTGIVIAFATGAIRLQNGSLLFGKGSPAEPASAVDPHDRRPRARYVRIEQAPGTLFNIIELQAFSLAENVAPRGLASASSQFEQAAAALAIDGETFPDPASPVGFAATAGTETGPVWWELDLGAETPLNRIVIFNRSTPNDPSIAKRLEHARLILLDGARRPIREVDDLDGVPGSIEFSF